MNMPTPQAPQLPAHLADFGAAGNIGMSAVGGINIGQSHPRISIKQNRFRLIDEQGQEFVVPQVHLDVIIVGANDFVSKLFYAKAFDPADPEPPAPTCFSDNGLAPSDRAASPQALRCSECPHAAWGSKVTPAGAKVKACSDSKKLAVVLADNPTGAVYELRIPAASMENLKAIVDSFIKRNEPIPAVVLRATFDTQTSYPKLLFQPVNYVTPEQKAAVLDVLGGEEAEEAVGKKDKARDPNQPLLAAPSAVPVPQVAQQAPTLPPVSMPAQPQFTPAVPQFVAPTAPMAMQVTPLAMPAGPQFAPQAPMPQQMPNTPPGAVQGQAINPMQPGGQTTPAKRTRRTKAQIAAEQAAQAPVMPAQQVMAPQPQYQAPQPQTAPMGFEAPPGMAATAAPQPVMPQFVAAQPAAVQAPMPTMPPMPAFLARDVPNAQPAAAAVPLQPQPTDASLDAILAGAMVRS